MSDFSWTSSIDLPVKGIMDRSPIVSSMCLQRNGSLWVSFLFADKPLLTVPLSKSALEFGPVGDFSLGEQLADPIYGVLGSLRATLGGDACFALLEPGFMPGFLGGKAFEKAPDAELQGLLREGLGGGKLRHSVMQYIESNFQLRSLKEPGSVADVFFLGEHVYGLDSSAFWREPYLKPEKRENLRRGLGANGRLHRSEEGALWFLGPEQRIYRMLHSDMRPLPTPLRLKADCWETSSASSVDAWLYGLADGKLFRVRRNPISSEEQMQYLPELSSQPSDASTATDQILDLCVAQSEEKVDLLVVLSHNADSSLGSLWTAELRPAEDSEDLEDPAELKLHATSAELGRCTTIQADCLKPAQTQSDKGGGGAESADKAQWVLYALEAPSLRAPLGGAAGASADRRLRLHSAKL